MTIIPATVLFVAFYAPFFAALVGLRWQAQQALAYATV
jgi:hypothetical protein